MSTGAYASLNIGRNGGDDEGAVSENRRRVFAALAIPREPSWLRQVHGVTVVDAARVDPSRPPDADASFAVAPGVVCVAQAADCLPVLFCDDAGKVVAAAHAGWRGLVGGVLEATVRALPAKPSALMAWMGPAIGPDSFEVGPEVRAAFIARDPEADRHFRVRPHTGGNAPEKYLADLFGLARQRLAGAGVTRVFGGGIDTVRDARRFFSFRRDGRCGRMGAFVWRAQ